MEMAASAKGRCGLETKFCPECKAPEHITREHLWLDNGDIIVRAKPENRIVFVESENLDPIFKGIEEIIGVPIENIVLSAARRAYRSYFMAFIPDDIKNKIAEGEMDYQPLAQVFADFGILMGQGIYEQVEKRFERDDDDFDLDIIHEPFCRLLNLAGHAAAVEAMTGRDQGIEYEEIAPGTYRSRTFPSPHEAALSERMHFPAYHHTGGDIQLERCGSCGGPRAISSYEWFPSRGLIVNRFTKKCMAFFGPQMLDPVFDELKEELGDTIPRVVVEAQRRFVRRGFFSMEDVSGEGDFRTQLALRGLGNLKEINVRRKGVRMIVDNCVLPLLIAGMMQGVFEKAFDIDSSIEWELSEEGRLEVQIIPSATKAEGPKS
jgi:hypothetical protein